MALVAQIIGMLGVATTLVAYYLLAAGKLSSHDARYPWLNIIGTLGIVVSLLYQWNLPSMVAQVLWILISLIGLVRIRLKGAR